MMECESFSWTDFFKAFFAQHLASLIRHLKKSYPEKDIPGNFGAECDIFGNLCPKEYILHKTSTNYT